MELCYYLYSGKHIRVRQKKKVLFCRVRYWRQHNSIFSDPKINYFQNKSAEFWSISKENFIRILSSSNFWSFLESIYQICALSNMYILYVLYFLCISDIGIYILHTCTKCKSVCQNKSDGKHHSCFYIHQKYKCMTLMLF